MISGLDADAALGGGGGGGAAVGVDGRRRHHQTTLAVISLDTTPGNTDVEDGGGPQDGAQPMRVVR